MFRIGEHVIVTVKTGELTGVVTGYPSPEVFEVLVEGVRLRFSASDIHTDSRRPTLRIGESVLVPTSLGGHVPCQRSTGPGELRDDDPAQGDP